MVQISLAISDVTAGHAAFGQLGASQHHSRGQELSGENSNGMCVPRIALVHAGGDIRGKQYFYYPPSISSPQ